MVTLMQGGRHTENNLIVFFFLRNINFKSILVREAGGLFLKKIDKTVEYSQKKVNILYLFI